MHRCTTNTTHDITRKHTVQITRTRHGHVTAHTMELHTLNRSQSTTLPGWLATPAPRSNRQISLSNRTCPKHACQNRSLTGRTLIANHLTYSPHRLCLRCVHDPSLALWREEQRCGSWRSALARLMMRRAPAAARPTSHHLRRSSIILHQLPGSA